MSIVHILDGATDQIIGTLNHKRAEYWNAKRIDSLENQNTFDFIANATLPKAELLTKRNRLLIQDEDGIFREYIIVYADQYKRSEKDIRSNASFTDLAKAKVIEPQTLQGATSSTATTIALQGTEWTPGLIVYTGIRTITIEEHTNPLALLNTIASEFELELRYRIEVDGNRVIGRYVDLVEQVAGFEGKEVAFGKDLVGIRRKEDSLNIVTALLGIGPEKEDGTRMTVLVEDTEALQRWGRNGQHLIETYEPESSDQDMTEARLRELTENELKKCVDAIVSYECEAVSLEHVFGRSHEKIRVGQTIRIKDDGYNPPLYVEARIQEVEVEQTTNRVHSFVIGNFIEYSKEELESQVSFLKKMVRTKVAIADYTATKIATKINESTEPVALAVNLQSKDTGDTFEVQGKSLVVQKDGIKRDLIRMGDTVATLYNGDLPNPIFEAWGKIYTKTLEVYVPAGTYTPGGANAWIETTVTLPNYDLLGMAAVSNIQVTSQAKEFYAYEKTGSRVFDLGGDFQSFVLRISPNYQATVSAFYVTVYLLIVGSR
jgi:phage minor structural protein